MVGHVAQLRLAIDGVAVDVDLGVQAVQIAVGLDHQRVHFQQGQVIVLEQLGEADEDVYELLDLVTLEAQLERQFARLEGLRAYQRIDGGLEDLLGRVVSDFFDVHATFGRRHEDDPATGAIDHGAQVELLVDIGARLDQNLADRLTIGIGLVGHQTLVEPLLGERSGLILAANQLYATRLATSTGMHLGLDHPLCAADLVAGFRCFLRAIYRIAFGHGQTVFSEQLFTLVLVKIHAFYRLFWYWRIYGTTNRRASLTSR